MGNYNPNDPCTVGMEWFVNTDYAVPLDSLTAMHAGINTALTTDEIQTLWLSVCAVFGTACIGLELYDITNGLPEFSELVEWIYYPGSDLYNKNTFGYGPYSGYAMVPPGSPPWIYPALANPVPNPGVWPNSGRPVPDDSFAFNIYGFGFEYACTMDSIAGTFGGRWITNVKSTVQVNELVDYALVGAMTITPYIQVNGQRFVGSATTINGEQASVQSVTAEWPFNPLTGLGWTPADMDNFDFVSGSNSGIGWIVNPTGSSNNLATMVTAWMTVVSAPTDERLRTGNTCATGSSPSQGWWPIVLLDPLTSVPTPYTLELGHTYLWAFRRTTGNAIVTLCAIEEQGAFLPGPPLWASAIPTVVGPGEPASGPLRIREIGVAHPRCFGLVFQATDATISEDSQPYVTTSPDGGIGQDAWPFNGVYFNVCPVDETRRIEQEFTPTVTDEYGYISALVSLHAGSASAPIVIRLRRRSDDALMGEVQFTDQDLEFPKSRWQRVGASFGPVVLDSGVQYYFDVRSTVTADEAWNLQIANAGLNTGPPVGPPIGSQLATYGGPDNHVSLGVPLADQLFMTAVVTVSTAPDVPAGFDALAHGETACGFDWIILSWDAAPAEFPCGFGYWEIQRSDDGGTTWGCVAKITDQDVTSIEDWESPRNQPARYRMRVVRSDHSPSAWTDVLEATATQSQPGLLFTSNEDPDLSVFYPDINRERPYEFPEKVVIHQPYMRDYQVAFRGLENRGVTFSATVAVRVGADVCVADPCYDYAVAGVGVFAPLLRIARESLSYVCVHNETGDRWLANVQTPTGTIRRGAVDPLNPSADDDGYYRMDIVVTEVTNTPSCVDAAGPGSGSGS